MSCLVFRFIVRSTEEGLGHSELEQNKKTAAIWEGLFNHFSEADIVVCDLAALWWRNEPEDLDEAIMFFALETSREVGFFFSVVFGTIVKKSGLQLVMESDVDEFWEFRNYTLGEHYTSLCFLQELYAAWAKLHDITEFQDAQGIRVSSNLNFGQRKPTPYTNNDVLDNVGEEGAVRARRIRELVKATSCKGLPMRDVIYVVRHATFEMEGQFEDQEDYLHDLLVKHAGRQTTRDITCRNKMCFFANRDM